MYLGCEQIAQAWRYDKYIRGLGTFSVPGGVTLVARHIYRCDHCGRQSQCAFQATEPFYCHSPACRGGQLISIEQAALPWEEVEQHHEAEQREAEAV